jgi:hypothetical protein
MGGGKHPTAGISQVHRSRYDRSKGEIVENEGEGKSGYKSECPQIAYKNRFQAEASEPLVGERSHRVDVSGEGLVYERRFDDRTEPGVEEDLAERAGVRDENVELLYQPGWP